MSGCTTTSLNAPDQPVTKCQVTLTGPQTAIAAVGGNGTVGVAAAPECAWSASTETAWITDVTPATGQGNANIQFKAAPNPASAARQGDISVSGTVVHVSQEAAACAFDVTPRTLTVPFAGGSGSVTVTTVAGCAWSAVSQVSWITVTSARDNSGAGTVTFDVAASTDAAARIGSITVAGQTVTVSQAARSCTYVVNPPTQTLGAAGGPGTVTVTTAATCTWTAASDVPWITISGGATGTANGVVNFVVAANTGSNRTGRVTVGSATVSVVQDAAAGSCSYSINPLSAGFPETGGAGASVTVAASAGCAWTATSNASWLAVTSGANGSGAGSVVYSVSANTGAARSGTLLIAGQTFTVNQASPPCAFGIGQTSQSVGNGSGTGATVAVTTQSFCSWTAVSNDSWITVSAPASGMGNGSVSWTYIANPTTSQRTGTMTIAGQTFTVTQDAGCSYSINPTSQSVGNGSGTGTTVAVTTQAGCAWTATSNASWITVTPPTTGTGSGSAGWTYVSNPVAAQRTGTMTIAGRTFTVTQDAACSYVISSTGQTVGNGSGTGSTVTVTTQAGCAWTAGSNASWIIVNSPGSGVGSGSVGWTYDANPGAQRTGTMTIAGQTFTVDQQGPCTYVVAPLGQTISALGGSGTPITVTTGIGCTWSAVSNDSWITVTSGASGTGTGTVQISIGVNVVFSARAGTLTIAGQVVTVIQDGVIP